MMKQQEVGYPCGACQETFETAEDFSNHFDRSDGKMKCGEWPHTVKKLRRPA